MFGSGWCDTDLNVCDTRNDILARDLDVHEFKPGTHNSVFLTGTLLDPYTGKSFEFLRGPGTGAAVQIDHIVALLDAWQKRSATAIGSGAHRARKRSTQLTGS